MTRTTITNLARAVSRGIRSRSAVATQAHRFSSLVRPISAPIELARVPHATFSTSTTRSRPVSAEALKTAQPADITDDEYHKLADQYIDDLLVKFEEEQDAKGEIDVEYSAGVMNIKYPQGTYVINKQPPNKQIWLSSPISGPKRFDYVVTSEGQDSKQDTAAGGWVYLRDGTYLNEIMQKETGMKLDNLDDNAVESL